MDRTRFDFTIRRDALVDGMNVDVIDFLRKPAASCTSRGKRPETLATSTGKKASNHDICWPNNVRNYGCCLLFLHHVYHDSSEMYKPFWKSRSCPLNLAPCHGSACKSLRTCERGENSNQNRGHASSRSHYPRVALLVPWRRV